MRLEMFQEYIPKALFLVIESNKLPKLYCFMIINSLTTEMTTQVDIEVVIFYRIRNRNLEKLATELKLNLKQKVMVWSSNLLESLVLIESYCILGKKEFAVVTYNLLIALAIGMGKFPWLQSVHLHNQYIYS